MKLVATFPDELVSTANAKSIFGCPNGPPDICGLPRGPWRSGRASAAPSHACNLATTSCTALVDEVPILTAIAYRGNALWGASWALVPGMANLHPLLP